MIAEYSLDPTQISPDQFFDCATALIHTILFHRSIDSQVIPKSIVLPGVDISYASAETEETSKYIFNKLQPMQTEVFSGLKEAWIILSLSYMTPKKGWFHDTYQQDIWERWIIRFNFATLCAKEIREQMLHTITQISLLATDSEVPRPSSSDSTFRFTLNLSVDKDWRASKDIVDLIKRLVTNSVPLIE